MGRVGEGDGGEFCRNLPHQAGVVAIPNAVFYDDPDAGRTQVRFAFCKRPEVLQDALARIEKWDRARRPARRPGHAGPPPGAGPAVRPPTPGTRSCGGPAAPVT